MTRKDYVLIAEAIKKASPTETSHELGTETTAHTRLAEYIATALSKDNPRFDYQKFLTACGL